MFNGKFFNNIGFFAESFKLKMTKKRKILKA